MSASASASSVLDLTQSRAPLTPQETFLKLAEDCTTLGVDKQDVYGDFFSSVDSSWLLRFEKEVSDRLGKEKGLFIPSGVMAQQIALLNHQGCRNESKTFVCHHTSHLLLHEKDCYSKLLHFEASIIPPNPGVMQYPITFSSAKPLLDSQPFALIVECPHREIGGKCTPYEDLQQLSSYCKSHDIKMHMDGARLWEATAAYGKTLEEICSLFDSVYVSFYKGLGGLSGAMLLGNEDFINESRVWLRRFGGNLYTHMPCAVSSWAGFRANVDDFGRRLDRLKHVIALITDVVLTKYPGVVRFDPPVPEVSLVHVYFATVSYDGVEWARRVRDEAAYECGIACFSRLREACNSDTPEACTEFNMGPKNMQIADEKWILGWETFARMLHQQLHN